jgi:hypothetical protein
MTFRLTNQERVNALRTVKARLGALHTEMTQIDSPALNI